LLSVAFEKKPTLLLYVLLCDALARQSVVFWIHRKRSMANGRADLDLFGVREKNRNGPFWVVCGGLQACLWVAGNMETHCASGDNTNVVVECGHCLTFVFFRKGSWRSCACRKSERSNTQGRCY
jgi:hypothetical protein